QLLVAVAHAAEASAEAELEVADEVDAPLAMGRVRKARTEEAERPGVAPAVDREVAAALERDPIADSDRQGRHEDAGNERAARAQTGLDAPLLEPRRGAILRGPDGRRVVGIAAGDEDGGSDARVGSEAHGPPPMQPVC